MNGAKKWRNKIISEKYNEIYIFNLKMNILENLAFDKDAKEEDYKWVKDNILIVKEMLIYKISYIFRVIGIQEFTHCFEGGGNNKGGLVEKIKYTNYFRKEKERNLKDIKKSLEGIEDDKLTEMIMIINWLNNYSKTKNDEEKRKIIQIIDGLKKSYCQKKFVLDEEGFDFFIKNFENLENVKGVYNYSTILYPFHIKGLYNLVELQLIVDPGGTPVKKNLGCTIL